MTTIDLEAAGTLAPIGQADLTRWVLLPGASAGPTSRCLGGSSDSWAAEEWAEAGTYEGQRAVRIYLFTSAEVSAAGDEASNLPWDDEHTARIRLL